MEEKNLAIQQASSCIISGLDYKNNSTLVFEAIDANLDSYDLSLLKFIQDTLQSQDTFPPSKFYCLYLLVQITEKKNPLFINKLASSKDLLNKIFQDAQYDKDKLLSEKGSTFFSKSPSNEDRITGKNYIRLTLEVLKFWGQTFPATDKEDPHRIFSIMFNALNKMVKFPDSYYFIGVSYPLTANFHLKQDFVVESARPSIEMRKQEPEADKQVFPLVVSCISSGKEYKQNYKSLQDLVIKGPKANAKAVVNVLSDILVSKEYPGKSRFYALYLLLQLTETQNKHVIKTLANSEKLLNKLFQDAQFNQTKGIAERGQTIFSKNPTEEEKIFGNNYLNMLIEAFTYWNQSYGSEVKEDPNYTFKMIYTTLKKMKVQFPTDYNFVQSNVSSIVLNIEERADFAQIYHNEKELINNAGKSQKVQITEPLIKLQSAGFSHLQKNLSRLDDTKKALKEYLNENRIETSESKEMLGFLYDDINQINKKDIQPKLEGLFENTDPESEKYVQSIITEGELVEALNREFTQYNAKRTNYSQFRSIVLQMLKEEGEENQEEKMITPGVQNGNKVQENEIELENESPNINEEPIKSTINSGAIINTPIEQIGTGSNRPGDLLEGEQISPIKKEESLSPKSHENSEFGQVELDNRTQSNKIEPNNLRGALIDNQLSPLSPENNQEVILKDRSNNVEEVQKSSVQQKEIPKQISKGIPPIYKSENKSSLSQSNRKLSGNDISSSRKKIPGEKLHVSFRNVEQNKSKVRVSDLTEIEDSIRRSFMRTGKVPPAFTPLDELKKKIELEQEISQLRKEKTHLAKENSLMKSQVIHGSFLLGTEERDEFGSGVKQRLSHNFRDSEGPSNQLVQEYQSKAEELQRKLAETKKELDRKAEEVENLKKAKKGISGNKDLDRLIAENAELKTDLEGLQKKVNEIASGSPSLMVTPKGNEKMTLKSQLRNLNKANEELFGTLEDMKTKNNTLSMKVQELEELQYTSPGREEFVSKIQKGGSTTIQKTEAVFGRADVKGRRRGGEGSRTSLGEGAYEPTQMKGDLVMKTDNLKRQQYGEVHDGYSSNTQIDQRRQVPENNYRSQQNSEQYNSRPMEEPKIVRSYYELNDNMPNNVPIESSKRNYESNRSIENPYQYVSETIRFQSSGRTQPTEYFSLDNRKPDYHDIHREDYEMKSIHYSELSKRSNYLRDDYGSAPRTFSNRKQEIPITSSEIYGQLIEYNNPFFIQLKKTLLHSVDSQEFLNFKLSCLKNKSLLHENEILQIGVNSTLLTDQTHKRKLLRLVIHYGNRVGIPIENFEPTVTKNKDIECVLNPETMNIVIEPHTQAKQQIISWIQNIPFECPELIVVGKIQRQPVNIRLYLPCLLNKFMEFKYTDTLAFEQRWHKNMDSVYRSSMIQLDENLIKSPYDFQKYFGFLVDLNPQSEYLSAAQGRVNKDLGGVFELDLIEIEYLLKISVFPSKRVIFQVIAGEKDYEVAKLILDTLVFLFQA